MKKLLTIAIVFICLNNLFAQTIRDSIFNNVILIKSTDVSTNGHFLIDIPIKPQKDPIVIFNDDFRIPANLFFSRNSFLYGQNEFILITPDWEFHKEIIEEQKRTGLHIKTSRNIIYHIKRNGSGYEVDSLSVVLQGINNPIKINFKKHPELNKNEVKYFLKECYGSGCCPKDPNLEFRQERDVMRNKFNEKYNVNVYKNTYRQTLGEEEEHCTYYTLSDLTNEQKIEFIFPPRPFTKTDDVIQGSYVIILPSVINTENMKHINQ